MDAARVKNRAFATGFACYQPRLSANVLLLPAIVSLHAARTRDAIALPRETTRRKVCPYCTTTSSDGPIQRSARIIMQHLRFHPDRCCIAAHPRSAQRSRPSSTRRQQHMRRSSVHGSAQPAMMRARWMAVVAPRCSLEEVFRSACKWSSALKLDVVLRPKCGNGHSFEDMCS